jgi:succinyl-diaminopimelate desuccinylase
LEKTIQEINKEIEGKLELVIDFNKQPVESNSDSELIQSIQSAFEQDLPLVGLSATTDAAEFTKAKKEFDVVIFGPGETELPHQVDEYVQVDQYLMFINLFKQIFPDYLKNEKNSCNKQRTPFKRRIRCCFYL